MENLQVFSGNANRPLAEKIAQSMGIQLGAIDLRHFPDGEIWCKYGDNVRGADVFIVQPICKQPNEMLMELLIMIDAARRGSAERITAVLPYYGYARQDRKDQPRVPITSKLVANLLVAAGADRVLTMDLHAQQIQGFFDIPVDHLHAAPVMVKHLREMKLDKPLVVSPDTGGVKTAYGYSQQLGTGLAIVAKQRLGATEVDAFSVVGNVEGCDVIMVDDMTTTCGTLCAAAKLLKAHGAKTVRAVVSHIPLTQVGIDRLRDNKGLLEELICTDSIPLDVEIDNLPVRVISVAPLLGEAITRIHNNQSVSSLFRLS